MAAAFTEGVVDVREVCDNTRPDAKVGPTGIGGLTGTFPPLIPTGRVFPPTGCTASLKEVKWAPGTGFGAVTAPDLLLAANAGSADRS
jgi:hypothetical protein